MAKLNCPHDNAVPSRFPPGLFCLSDLKSRFTMAIFVPHILAHTKYYAGVGKFDNPGEEHGLRKYNIESALVIVHIAAALLHALRSLCILRWSNQVAAPEATPHRHVTMRMHALIDAHT